jgi:undecaprenyl-diphosphatase
MNFLDAMILGIVEGITEFLPVSSTGHLILTSAVLKLSESDFLKSFEISIQLGAILSVVVLYARTLLKNLELIKKTIVAFLPTGILGLAFYKIIKHYLLGNTTVVVVSLLIGGIFLILFEVWHGKHAKGSEEISYRQALLIGLCQSFSMIPGVSRSAATIIGGMLLGVERKSIVEFSFLLAIPTMGAATGLDLLKSAHAFSMDQIEILAAGFIVSFIVALLAVKFFIRYIQHHTFIAFGIYRILLAVAFYLYVGWTSRP